MTVVFPTINELFTEVERYPRFWQTFTSLRFNEQRVAFVSYIVNSLTKKVPDLTEETGKSSIKSCSFREDGMKLLSLGSYASALENFNISVATAPTGSRALSFSFADRSIVLMRMGHIKESIKDIDRALAVGYPKDRAHKLCKRKGQLLSRIGEFEKAIFSFKVSKVQLKNSRLTLEDQAQQSEELLLEIEKCKRQMIHPPLTDFSKASVSSTQRVVPPNVSYGLNADILGASSCVKLETDEKFGRYFVAARDIKAGDVLLSCDRFASKLEGQFLSTHCSACLQRNLTLLPCTNCSYALFCSEGCWQRNIFKHVLYECKYYAQCLNFQIPGGPSLLAYKLIAEAGFQETLVHYELWKKSKNVSTLANGVYKMNIHNIFNITTFYEMNTCFNVEKDSYQLFRFCVQACSLIPVVNHFIPKAFEYHYKVILVHLFVCSMRQSVSIDETQCGLGFTRRVPQVVGIGFSFPRSSIPHSCCSNSVSFTAGTKQITCATTFIKKGSKITQEHVCSYTDVTKATRQAQLRRLLFSCDTCKCQACVEDWPVCDDMPDMPTYLEPDNLKLCLDAFETVKDLWSDDSYMNKISNIANATRVASYLNVVSRVGGHKCKKFVVFQEFLMFYWSDANNLYEQKYW